MTAATPLRCQCNNKAVHLSVISVDVRVQAKILNEPHEVSRVEHKQDWPEDRTLVTPQPNKVWFDLDALQ